MGISDRLFALPPPDAAKVEARLALLPPEARSLIERAGAMLAGANGVAAQAALTRVLAEVPGQPDAMRLHGLLLARTGDLAAAADRFEGALRAAPDDAMGYWQYARVQEDAGQVDAALALRRLAVERLPESPAAWADLGDHFYRRGSIEAALVSLERAVALAPKFAPALFKLGTAYVAFGRADDGATLIRRALEREPGFGAAWLGLVDVKTVSITRQELAHMRALLDELRISAHRDRSFR